MDLSTLTPAPGAKKQRKRVGRGPGSGTGKTCGRGHKGQKSRSGYRRRRGFEGGQMPLNRRLPKRGFHQDTRFPFAVVNLDTLEKAFDAGAEVTPETLLAANLIEPEKGGVKILGRGDVTKKFVVKVTAISAAAKTKIEAAGGSVELLASPSRAGKKQQAADQE
ncbi:MAG: 50S ribosomal protein L15 [bacterium]|nr:50S ribosomal protein L15 [bacterium]